MEAGPKGQGIWGGALLLLNLEHLSFISKVGYKQQPLPTIWGTGGAVGGQEKAPCNMQGPHRGQGGLGGGGGALQPGLGLEEVTSAALL